MSITEKNILRCQHASQSRIDRVVVEKVPPPPHVGHPDGRVRIHPVVTRVLVWHKSSQHAQSLFDVPTFFSVRTPWQDG